MLLSHTAVERAARRGKVYDLRDGEGLYLHVTPSGSKIWRYRFLWNGKAQTLTIGHYPATSIAQARQARIDARNQVLAGINPCDLKRQTLAETRRARADTFEALAREWHELQTSKWSTVHADDVLASLENLVFPKIGNTPLKQITSPIVFEVLRAIQARGAIETAHRARQRISAVFVYAVASGHAETDPAAMLTKALAPIIRGRQPAVRTLEEAREILERVRATPAHPVTKLALVFLAVTVVRPGTLITTPWSESRNVNPQEPTWIVPPARLKLKKQLKLDQARQHFVPLPPQAIELLQILRRYSCDSPFLFPNVRWHHRPLCENAIGYLLNRAGYHGRHVAHVWRATFSTVMNGLHPLYSKVIDQMLAHTPENEVEVAYNRQNHMQLRRKLAEEWVDRLLDGFDLQSFAEGPRRTVA